MGSAASTAYRLGQETEGSSSVAAGLRGVAQAAGGAARTHMSESLGLKAAAASGQQAAFDALAGRGATGASPSSAGEPPAWAQALRRRQDARHHRQLVVQTLREGDRGGASATPDISQKED